MLVRSRVINLFTFIFILSFICLSFNFGSNPIKFGNVIFLGSLLVIFFGGVYISIKSGLFVKFGKSDFWYCLLALYTLFSVAWSPSKNSALFHSLFLFMVLFGSLIISNVSLKYFLSRYIWIMLFLAILSLGAMFLFPDYAYQPSASTSFPELRGVFRHQLGLGIAIALAIGLMVTSYINNEWDIFFRSKGMFFFVLLFFTVILFLSFARSTMVFLIVSLFLMKPVAFGRIKLYLLSIFSLSMLWVAVELNDVLYFFSENTLNGRLTIWIRTVESGGSKLFGLGFSSFEHMVNDSIWNLYRPAHAHNSFVQLYYELGFIGVILCFFLILANFKEIITSIDVRHDKIPYSLCAFFLLFFGSLMSVYYGAKPNLPYALLLSILIIERPSARHVRLSI
jgi:exopolysaccharide production protein ExoQ